MQNFDLQATLYTLNSQILQQKCFYTAALIAGGKKVELFQKQTLNSPGIVDFSKSTLVVSGTHSQFIHQNHQARIIIYAVKGYGRQQIFGTYDFSIMQQGKKDVRAFLKQCKDQKAFLLFDHSFIIKDHDISQQRPLSNAHSERIKINISHEPLVSKFLLPQNIPEKDRGYTLSEKTEFNLLRTTEQHQQVIDILNFSLNYAHKHTSQIEQTSTKVGEQMLGVLTKSNKFQYLKKDDKNAIYDIMMSRQSILKLQHSLSNQDCLEVQMKKEQFTQKKRLQNLKESQRFRIDGQTINEKYVFNERKKKLKIKSGLISIHNQFKKHSGSLSRSKIIDPLESFADSNKDKSSEKLFKVVLTSRKQQNNAKQPVKQLYASSALLSSKIIETSSNVNQSESYEHAKIGTLSQIKKGHDSVKQSNLHFITVNSQLLEREKKYKKKLEIAEKIISQKEILLGKKFQSLMSDNFQLQRQKLNTKIAEKDEQISKLFNELKQTKHKVTLFEDKMKQKQNLICTLRSMLNKSEQSKMEKKPTEKTQQTNYQGYQAHKRFQSQNIDSFISPKSHQHRVRHKSTLYSRIEDSSQINNNGIDLQSSFRINSVKKKILFEEQAKQKSQSSILHELGFGSYRNTIGFQSQRDTSRVQNKIYSIKQFNIEQSVSKRTLKQF